MNVTMQLLAVSIWAIAAIAVVGLGLSGPLAVVATVSTPSVVGLGLGGPLAISVSSISTPSVVGLGLSRPLAISVSTVSTPSVVRRGSSLGLGIRSWLSIGRPLAIVTSIAVASVVGFGRGQSASRQHSKSKLHLVTMVLSD